MTPHPLVLQSEKLKTFNGKKSTLMLLNLFYLLQLQWLHFIKDQVTC